MQLKYLNNLFNEVNYGESHNAFDTYTATADREDLSNIIYNISPNANSFMSSIGTRNVKNVVFDWQTESLPTPWCWTVRRF